MLNGNLKEINHYTVLNVDMQIRVCKLIYEPLQLVKTVTLIDTKSHQELASGIDSYSFDASEKMILLVVSRIYLFVIHLQPIIICTI
jgi:dipeptidyl-peptidase-4